jgi:hypothetical protein
MLKLISPASGRADGRADKNALRLPKIQPSSAGRNQI